MRGSVNQMLRQGKSAFNSTSAVATRVLHANVGLGIFYAQSLQKPHNSTSN